MSIGYELIAVTPVPPSRREREPRTELQTCVGKWAESSINIKPASSREIFDTVPIAILPPEAGIYIEINKT